MTKEEKAIRHALATFPFLEDADDARRFFAVLDAATRGLKGHQLQVEVVVSRVASALMQAVSDPVVYRRALEAIPPVLHP